jgi:hypothetical protein
MRVLLLIKIFILFCLLESKAQSPTRLDSLPYIQIKKNIALQILGIYPTGAWLFGASCNNYIIGKNKYLNPTPMKPYFDKLGDSLVLYHYQQHRDMKPVYFTGYGTGMLLYFYGIGKNISATFSSNNSSQAGGQVVETVNDGKAEIYAGLGIIVAATIVRIVSFSHLHKAKNRYNQLIIKPKMAFDIRSNEENLGLGLRMSF